MSNLSIKYGVLCPHTAFIGIEKRLNANNESNADMELREVPIMTHASVQYVGNVSSSASSYAGATTYARAQYSRNVLLSSQDVADVNSIMEQNLNMVLSRGDCLDDLVARSECLDASSRTFYKASRRKSSGFSGGIGSIMRPITGFVSSLFTRREDSKHDTSTNTPLTSTSLALESTYQSSTNPTSQTSSVAWPTDEQKLIERFIDLQQYDGLWILTDDDVKQLTGKSLTTFSSSTIENMEEKQKQTIIATAIVIIILETRCSSVKTLWQALVNKGNKRLKELLGSDETKVEQLMKDIRDQL